MTPRERFLCALRGGVPDRVPYFEYAIHREVARAAFGRCPEDPLEFNRMVGRVDLEVWRKPPVFARYVKTPDGRTHLAEGLIRTREDCRRLFKLPHPLRYAKGKEDPAAIEDAAARVAEKGEFALGLVVSLSADPVLLSMGFDGLAYALADDPGLVGELLDRYADWAVAVLEEYQELDFDFVLCGDDLAHKTAPFMSPGVFRDLFLPRMRRVAEAIRLPWILHCDGNLRPIWDDLLSLGMNALHPVEPEAMDIFALKREMAGRLTLCGNFDINILALGTAEQTRREVLRKMTALAPGGGYVAASSTSIPDYVRPECFRAMVEAMAEYNDRRARG
jgi:uroporphyrinogen decarboxylase